MIKINGEILEPKKFPNNEVQMYLDDNLTDTIFSFDSPSTEINIEFYYENDQDLINLMFVKKDLDILNHFTTNKLDITLSLMYLPYSRMDRTDRLVGFTLKHVADFINSLQFDAVIILEPHSNVATALINHVYPVFINDSFIDEYVLSQFEFNLENDYVLFPDNGAAMRYKYLDFDNVLIGHKDRNFNTGKIKKLEIIGDIVNPEKVLIIDDLCSYGGTFVNSAKKLKEIGFKEVYLYVTHAENSIFKGELFNHVDKVITTNSILTEQNNWENKKYKEQLVVLDANEVLKWLLQSK